MYTKMCVLAVGVPEHSHLREHVCEYNMLALEANRRQKSGSVRKRPPPC